MARRPVISRLTARLFSTSKTMRNAGQTEYENHKIGLREIVGFGMNGQPKYIDTPIFPYPAVRFQEISSCYKALKEKEKGDWRSLSLEEKKTLYRISFCQTFSEMNAPTGEWKSIIGYFLCYSSLGLAFFIFQQWLFLEPYPDSFKEERRIAQLKRMLAFRMNPIDGLASKWDYEKERWK